MLTTMLVMAIAVIFEPVRLGLAVLMLNRPRPFLQLAAFVIGGFVICFAAGLVVLFVLRATPLKVAHGFSVSQIHIAIGVFALLIALAVVTNVVGRVLAARRPVRVPTTGGNSVAVMTSPADGTRTLSTRARSILGGESLWVAGATGAFNLPSANYMAALALILASEASPTHQVQALLAFNVAAFTIVGLPLISYVAAPHKTRAFMAALHTWLRARKRPQVAAMVGAVGCVMLGLGIVGI